MVRKISLFNKTDSRLVRGENWGFDEDFYLKNNPDVALSGANPRNHYSEYGWREGRDPSDYFSVKGYLVNNPDVAAARVDPLDHFIKYGAAEQRTGWRRRTQDDLRAELKDEIQALRDEIAKRSLSPSKASDSHHVSEVSVRGSILASASALPLTPRAKTLFCRLHDIASKQ